MRPFPLLAALLAVVVAAVAEAGARLGSPPLVNVLACLAAAVVTFNWWELWSTRQDR